MRYVKVRHGQVPQGCGVIQQKYAVTLPPITANSQEIIHHNLDSCLFMAGSSAAR